MPFLRFNELKIQNLPIMRPKVVNDEKENLLHHCGGDVGVKKLSQFLDSGTWSTTFGDLKIGTFENAPPIFFCIFGRHSYRYNIYQVRMEFRKLFDILVRPNGHEQLTALETTKRKTYTGTF